MTRDEAASVLGAAGDAYFGQPCPTCAGEGLFVGDIMRPNHVTECPTCEGGGEMQMPPPDEIRRAAAILTFGETMPDANKESPPLLYLEPPQDDPGIEGRVWCQDPVWDEESVEYVRADLVRGLTIQWGDPFEGDHD